MEFALMDRQETVVNALRIIAHTSLVDPMFMQHCIAEAGVHSGSTGFGNMLEQNEYEFRRLLSHVKGCRSALEIGSRYGKSIQRIAAALEPQSRVVAVDLPMTESNGELPAPEPILRESIKSIGEMGHEAHLFLGDSHSPALVKAVRDLGPYDFCFIDGDHRYEGVKADWENFGPHAKIVAFHDIVNNVDCARLWREIKATHRTMEYTESVWLGIGVVFKDN